MIFNGGDINPNSEGCFDTLRLSTPYTYMMQFEWISTYIECEKDFIVSPESTLIGVLC